MEIGKMGLSMTLCGVYAVACFQIRGAFLLH